MLVVSLRYHCELDPTVYICVGLAFAWTVVSCVIVLLGLANYLTDYLFWFNVAKRPCSSNC